MSAQAPSPHSAAPDPGQILGVLTLYQVPMALKGALDLELFTHIAQGATTAAEIATRCQAAERGVRILCDFLTVHGFLTKNVEAGSYGLSPTAAAFLVKTSPAYLGSIANFLTHEVIRGNFNDVAAIVRKGGSVFHSTLRPSDAVWVEFAKSMAPMMGLPAKMVAPQVTTPGTPQKVLDIAAGHGVWGLSIAQHNPAAEVTFQDWENVLAVARENAAKSGCADRCHYIPGSAFDVDFGSGYDLILLPNFLHHFDEPTCVKLLQKVRAALKPGGTVATIEFVPNPDRISPPMPATFSMMMLGGTEAGDAYTYAELDRMFRAAGFGSTEMRRLDPLPPALLITQYA